MNETQLKILKDFEGEIVSIEMHKFYNNLKAEAVNIYKCPKIEINFISKIANRVKFTDEKVGINNIENCEIISKKFIINDNLLNFIEWVFNLTDEDLK